MSSCNYSYFPIIVVTEETSNRRDGLFEHLQRNNIEARKYFEPMGDELIKFFEHYRYSKAFALSRSILCLPFSARHSYEQLDFIVAKIRNYFKHD